LEVAAEDGDGVVLGCYVVEGFGAAGRGLGCVFFFRYLWFGMGCCFVLFLNPWL
jgi:hypothetical protein